MSGTPSLSKSEIRNPKPEGNPKPENTANGHIFRISAFGFLSDFGLRISGGIGLVFIFPRHVCLNAAK